ncbi:MAG TPA: TIGR03016 family PEP-CTERM system-associated outer membrane protein [Candidatus Competibacteraceae bacterium]|nr:TIGR03016 family PEP-CTERM system-associated outer membrane protein [Candidatus Competibacteraceae bacterium]
MALASGGASAWADWEFTPRISVSETYTDNVTQAPRGFERDDWITSVNPGFTLDVDGERLDLLANYDLEALYYIDNSDGNDLYHRFTADGRAELLKDRLFLDARGLYTQQIVNPEAPAALSNLFLVGNRTDVFAYSVSPYYKQEIGNLALAELRYGYSSVDYEDEDLSDSEGNRVELLASSLPRSDGRGWVADYAYDKLEFDDFPDARFERVTLGLRQPLTGRTSLLLGVGYEDNEFEQAPGAEDPSGFLWTVGLAWNPSTLTSLEVGVGERFFGNTYFLRFDHRTRYGTWSVRYEEDLASTAQLEIDRELLSPTRLDETGFLERPLVGFPRITPEIFLQKLLVGSYTYERGTSRVDVDAYNVRREFEVSGDEDNETGAVATWTWGFAPRTDLILGGRWRQREFSDLDRVDNGYGADLSVVQEFGERASGGVGYRYYRLDSDDPTVEYRVNLLFAEYSMSF